MRRGRFNKFWLAPILFEDSFYFQFGKEDRESLFSLKKEKNPFWGLIHVLFVLSEFQNMFYTMVCVLFCPYKNDLFERGSFVNSQWCAADNIETAIKEM